MNKGTGRSAEKSISIICAVRNPRSKHWRNIANLVSKLEELFRISGIFIVESDSNFFSPRGLSKLSNKYEVKIARLGNLKTSFPSRVSRIAHCRDNGLQLFFESGGASYVCIFDPDNHVNSLEIDNSVPLFLSENSDSCLFPIGRKAYYDLLALKLSSTNTSIELPNSTVENKNEKKVISRIRFLKSWQVFFVSLSKPIETDSAFGGLGIYPSELVRPGDYSFDKTAACEHHSISQQVRHRGGRLVIHPGLVLDVRNEHIYGRPNLLTLTLIFLKLLPTKVSNELYQKVRNFRARLF